MKTTRLMNVLVALLLVAGQLAGGVHLASHVVPEPALAQGSSWHTTHNHQALEHAGHLHAHIDIELAASMGSSINAHQEKAHSASDCALCHLTTHLLVIVPHGPFVPQALSIGANSTLSAKPAPPLTLITANTIRGPPSLS